jgi:hypothetical protein
MICLEQARWAVKWSEEGKAIDEIRRLNDSRFG